MAKVNEKLLAKQREQQAAEQENKIIDYMKRTGHSRPTTRREFLGSGAISFSGYMILPSILNMLARVNPAYAADCAAAAAGGGSTLTPFVTINLSGGWAGHANWLPRDIGGQLLPSYSKMGSGKTPTTVNAFANNALFTTNANTAGFLAGVRSAADATTLAKTAFVGMPVRSNDDTGNNRFDIGGLLAKANLAGQKLPNMGQRDTNTGLNHVAAYNVLPPAPLRVSRIEDITGALGFTGNLATLSQAQQLSLVNTVKKLSDSQARRLATMSGGENVSNLVECATAKNVENVAQGAGQVDPRGNNTLAAIWNFGNQGELARAGMALNAITGLAGAVGMEIGGYDYHGNSRANTDASDLAAGKLVGQVLQTAAALNKPVFIYLCSDGSVSSDVSDAVTGFQGDSGDKGTVYMIAFRPNAAPPTKGSQLGGFTAGQSADNTFITGGNPETGAAAVFANWAKLSGDTSLIQKVIPNVFTQAQLDQILMFG